MRLWKCFNPKCADRPGVPGHDFTGDDQAGVCPKCGIASSDPRFGKFIVPRVVIHYDAPSGVVDGCGVGYAACDKSKTIGVYRGTGVPSAVTCPSCRESEAWRAADQATHVHPDYDVPVVVDPQAGTVQPAK